MTQQGLDLRAIRERLKLTQEVMARLLTVSFVSVNRWENGHAYPKGLTLEIYRALDRGLSRRRWRSDIPNEPDLGRRLFLIFDAAYGTR